MSNVTFLRENGVDNSFNFQELHGSITPENIYKTDPIEALISVKNGLFKIKVPVYRISPLGVECDITEIDLNNISFNVGDDVELILSLGNQKTSYIGITIATKHIELGKTLIGFRFIISTKEQNHELNRRKTRRWLCGDEFLPTGISPNPIKFNDYIFYRVVDFSSNGMQILTSLRNKTLIKGMTLEGNISLPMVGQILVFFKIVSARTIEINGKESLSLGCEFLDLNKNVSGAIGQYILQFSEKAEIIELKKSGLNIQSAAKSMTFGFVKTKEDYEEVLKLRFNAYKNAGKMKEIKNFHETSDIYDSRARIITASYNGALVGSVRLMFHGSDDEMEHEQFVKFPDNFPSKYEIVEVTRVCTDANFRSSDLFLALMKQMALLIVQSKRRYMLGSATEKLIPIYERLGFERTGIKYTHVDLGDEEHEILLADIPLLISGSGVSFKTWLKTYSDVADFLDDVHGVEFDPSMNLRIKLYKAFGKFLNYFQK